MKIIETGRLLVRDLRRSDWQAVHEYTSDPEVVQYVDWGPNTDSETKEFIQRAITNRQEKPRSVFTLAIVLKDKKRLVGSCGIHISNPENREGWLGYCLNRKYWSKGYETETSTGLVNFGFAKLNLHRIFGARAFSAPTFLTIANF